MSFNPVTGLVYLPAQNVPRTLKDNPQWTYKPESWNTAMFVDAVPPRSKPFGRLIAWDPVRQKEAWRHEYVGPWNGGTLTTAGNLVFQGTADGRFVAFNATTGQKLWQSPTGTGVVAGPVTYLVDGVQYVSVAAGWGGVYGLTERATDHKVPGTVYTFAIGGKAALPKFVEYSVGNLISGVKYEPSDVKPGQFLYYTNCYSCHGIPGISGGGNIGNLGYVPAAQIEHLEAIVLGGTYKNAGMPDFVGRLNAGDVRRIKAYIQGTADAIRARTTVQ
jgi:quinohemoprotein ethanol dehydrogenase